MTNTALTLSQDRHTLFEAVQSNLAGVTIRRPEDFSQIDDGVFYAFGEDREMFVSIVPEVTWGPNLDSYIDEPDEYRPRRRLWVTAPNKLGDQVLTIVALFHRWFDDAKPTEPGQIQP